MEIKFETYFEIELLGITDEEILKLVQLDRDLLAEQSWSISAWNDLLRKNANYFLLIGKMHDIIGMMLFCLSPIENLAHLLKFAVKQEFQKRGIGLELFYQASSDLVCRKYQRIYLEVATDNNKAIEFYKKQGFDVLHHCKHFYSNKKDAYKMMKFL